MKKQLEQETSRERFRRLATLRTNLVLKRLKILGNCSNRHVYEYDEEDIDKIFAEIVKQNFTIPNTKNLSYNTL